MSRPEPQDMSIPKLASAVSADAAEIVRGEVRLAIGELQAKGLRAGPGIGTLGAAAIVAGYGGAALVLAGVAALAPALHVWAAALIVSVVLFAVAALVGPAGKSRTAQAFPPAPERAVAGAREDIRRVKESLHR